MLLHGFWWNDVPHLLYAGANGNLVWWRGNLVWWRGAFGVCSSGMSCCLCKVDDWRDEGGLLILGRPSAARMAATMAPVPLSFGCLCDL